jgi:hypothetical protein
MGTSPLAKRILGLRMPVVLRCIIADFIPRRLLANKLMGLVLQVVVSIEGIDSYWKAIFF